MKQYEPLERCPFCGSEAHLTPAPQGGAGGWFIRCGIPGSVYEPEKGCGARSRLCQIRADAAEAWNLRISNARN